MIPSIIIEKKRDGKILSNKEIKWFIESHMKNEIDDCQMSALLMAIYIRGMIDEELFSLVDVMVNSGARCDFSHLNSYVADKHSTGGIGDKISLILLPILSSLGFIIPMIAGRGLAFTGGTIDKLNSIKNFKTELSLNEFIKNITATNCAIISQSNEICPADKKIYAIRDITGTIPSLPLICSSIMSKKIAEGLDGLVLDIKVGNGAFMKNISQAKKLANSLIKIGENFDIKTEVSFTNMDQPLGNYAGLTCEVIETIDFLKGNCPADLMEVTLELGIKILRMSNFADDYNSAKKIIMNNLNSGKALNKFTKIISSQGGDINHITSNTLYPKNDILIKSTKNGYLSSFNTEQIGWSLVEIGCGKKSKNDKLDYSAGIEFVKKIGQKIKKGDTIYRVFGRSEKKLDMAKLMLIKSFSIIDKPTKQKPLVLN